MNKKLIMFLTVVLTLMILFSCSASAQISGINIMGIRPDPEVPQVYFELRALDNVGEGLRTQRQDFHFTSEDGTLELPVLSVPESSVGHILVVDTSSYYFGSKYIHSKDIQDILHAYLTRLTSGEQVMFILASGKNQPASTGYMSIEQARDFVQSIELSGESSSNLGSAIVEAFHRAIQPESGDPMFNSVFIVADPALSGETQHSFYEALHLRESSNILFDVAVAYPLRQQFLDATSSTRRQEVQKGIDLLTSFGTQAGGPLIKIPQDNKGVQTENLHVALSNWLYTTNRYAVDLSPLAGHVSETPSLQVVPVSVSCAGEYGNAVRIVEVPVKVDLLPEPSLTPAPTASLEPTFTPAPTPVVAVGQADSMAMQAIYALTNLHYLEDRNADEFDNTVFLAYIDFCKNNGVDPRDGIYEETYNLLISNSAVPAAQMTPEPTATPQPTIPPEGYSLYDQDTEDSGQYITQMQTILKALNCYSKEDTAIVGQLDQATLYAVSHYCEAFNWKNEHENGVSKVIVSEILSNGPNLDPIPVIEPSANEKALAFLQKSVHIGSLSFSMWIPIVLCVVLVFAILAAFIIWNGKDGQKSEGANPNAKTEKPGKSSPAASSKVPVPSMPNDDSINATVGSDMECTITPDNENVNYTVISQYTKPVQLEVQFGNNFYTKDVQLSEARPFTIGRLNCDLVLDKQDTSASRKHAEIRYANDTITLYDLSSYHNTTVDGMSLNNLPDHCKELHNGSVIQISKHQIYLKW